nr:11940_t:CDS:2 [Entrophospora candida]
MPYNSNKVIQEGKNATFTPAPAAQTPTIVPTLTAVRITTILYSGEMYIRNIIV